MKNNSSENTPTVWEDIIAILTERDKLIGELVLSGYSEDEATKYVVSSQKKKYNREKSIDNV